MILKVTWAEGALDGGEETCETRGWRQRTDTRNKANARPRTLEHTIWSHPTRPLDHRSAAILWLVVVQRHIAKALTKTVSENILPVQALADSSALRRGNLVRSSAFTLWRRRDARL
jgi:hypothetical protein